MNLYNVVICSLILYHSWIGDFRKHKRNIDEDEVEYYADLIERYIKNGENYSYPTENLEFQTLNNNGSIAEDLYDYGTFDFVIIGSGSAGSVIASRLSEIPEWKVLLLEAGEKTDELSEVPGYYYLMQGTKWDWGYLTTQQTNLCQGMRDRKCRTSRGKALGGSSAINGLVYCRGWKKDYDQWEQLGLHNWNYENLLPYFKKSENSTLYPDSYYHGKTGPLEINYAVPDHPMLSIFINSQLQLNSPYVDYNEGTEIGHSRVQLTTKHGRRESVYSAYLHPIRNRENLKVSTDSFVHRILFDYNFKEANGVHFIKNSRRFMVKAKREVILSAGAYNSPQILLLSGIGPKEDLKELHIPIIEDIPAVGRNLKDHVSMINLVFRTNFSLECSELKDSVREFLKGKGILTSPGAMYGIAFAETKSKKNGVPDNEFIFMPPSCSNTRYDYLFNPNENLKKDYAKHRINETDFHVYSILLHPRSTGKVTLKSNNPKDFPEIDSNMLSDPYDVEIMYRGIQEVLRWLETPAFSSLNARLISGINDCDHHTKYSKLYWICRIRHEAALFYHPTGTAKMARSKEEGVVNANMKVFGVKKLRVADASVIPTTISGHTNAIITAIAERVSDFIKCEHGHPGFC